MPSFFSGRSMMWPTVARTRYPRPRYLPMVFAFAGDSTITRVPPSRAGAPVDSSPSSYSTAALVFFPRADFGARVFAEAFGARFFVKELRPPTFRDAIYVDSVNRLLSWI